jgi:hypothetical protein
MRKAAALTACVGLAAFAACSPDSAPTAPTRVLEDDMALEMSVPGQENSNEPRAHVEFIRGVTNAAKGARGGHGGPPSPNITYHGGPVMASGATVKAIFWGTGWSSPGDKISGLDTFYGGIGGSGYMHTNTEYTDGSGAHASASVSYAGHVIDGSNGPKSAPSTATVLGKVCTFLGSANVTTNGYYPVYTDLPRGNAGYCAWHSAGDCGGKTIQFAFFFLLDGDSGCDPQSTVANTSQGLAALANVSGHELSEAATDPHLNAWYDRSGYENADKCAWTFSGTVSIGGKSWKIQGNWSNNAYDAGTGYYNRGCIETA